MPHLISLPVIIWTSCLHRLYVEIEYPDLSWAHSFHLCYPIGWRFAANLRWSTEILCPRSCWFIILAKDRRPNIHWMDRSTRLCKQARNDRVRAWACHPLPLARSVHASHRTKVHAVTSPLTQINFCPLSRVFRSIEMYVHGPLRSVPRLLQLRQKRPLLVSPLMFGGHLTTVVQMPILLLVRSVVHLRLVLCDEVHKAIGSKHIGLFALAPSH